jgi:transcriptional regulator with XRE-family HTH domain
MVMKRAVIKAMPNFVKAWREYRQLTQDQLAEATDISPAQISKIENGQAKFSHDSLYRLARALKCSPADLIARNPTKGLDIELWELIDGLSDSQKRQLLEVGRVLVTTSRVA